jgi:NADH-quinone oxidoreductase subunit J
MDLQALAFYVLASVAVIAALLVVSVSNPVHSVLALILTFFSTAGLFVLLGAEFLAMLLVVVYVGAVAVLFLFVVMMLDVDFSTLRRGFTRYLPYGGALALLLAIEMGLTGAAVAGRGAKPPSSGLAGVSNTEQIGRVLYTDYFYYFQAAGLVLLVAMIGAIVLTLRHKPGVKRQDIAAQTARTEKSGVRLVKPVIGQGVSE